MGEWVPAGIAVMIVIIMSLFLPTLLADFVDLDSANRTTLVNTTIGLVQDGVLVTTVGDIELLGINISILDPTSYVPTSMGDWWEDTVVYMTFIPSALLIALLSIIFLGLLYTIIKLFPTT